jgi:hypothetical protein
MNRMEKLYKALKILLDYVEKRCPGSNCDFSAEHDVLYIGGPSKNQVDPVDVAILAQLGVYWDEEYESWKMFT